ncbi:MAG TPA: cupredoxin domain-containing protein [Gemmatimonadales bacterium]|nr:cupredoxin domain-containing protein [Gemmatimonadales bacterium]
MQFARLAVAVAIGVGVIAACSSSSTAPGGGGHTTSITVQNNSFNPTPDTVPVGQVTFTWATPSNGHNVTWLTGPGTLPANSTTQFSGTYQATLQLGTYTYHCTIHSGMNGTIVVH